MKKPFKSYAFLLREFPYLKQLSITDRAWLTQFAKEESGYFKKGVTAIHNEAMKTEISRKRDSYRRDIMNRYSTIEYEEGGGEKE